MTVKELRDMISNEMYDDYEIFAEKDDVLFKPNGVTIDKGNKEICIDYEDED